MGTDLQIKTCSCQPLEVNAKMPQELKHAFQIPAALTREELREALKLAPERVHL